MYERCLFVAPILFTPSMKKACRTSGCRGRQLGGVESPFTFMEYFKLSLSRDNVKIQREKKNRLKASKQIMHLHLDAIWGGGKGGLLAQPCLYVPNTLFPAK